LLDVGLVALGLQPTQRLLSLHAFLLQPGEFQVKAHPDDFRQIPQGVKHIGDARTGKPVQGQFHQRLGAVTDEIAQADPQRRQRLFDPPPPGVIAPIRGRLFEHDIPRDQIHHHQNHLIEKRLIGPRTDLHPAVRLAQQVLMDLRVGHDRLLQLPL
jgi:hypothetical protein